MKTVLYMGCNIPDGNAAAVRVFYNALAIKEYGCKVAILSFDDHLGANSHEVIRGIEVYRVQYPRSSREWAGYLIELKAYADAMNTIGNVDTVITYDQPGVSFLRLKHYCKKRGIKLYCDCAEWHAVSHLKGIAKAMKTADINLSMRYAYKKADGVIAISSYLAEYYKNHTNVLVVPPLQERYPVAAKEFSAIRRFIYAGSAGTDKDRLDLIIEAFSKVEQPYQFDVYGMTEEEFLNLYPNLNTNIEKIRENASLIFHGKVAHSEIVKETQNSDFTLLIRNHSRKNDAGFPTKFAESICCGTPVIASDFSDVKAYIQEQKLGFVVDSLQCLTKYITYAICLSSIEYGKIRDDCNECKLFEYKYYSSILGFFLTEL